MSDSVLVPNKLQLQYRLSKEFLETARSLEIPASSGLRLLQAYADAVGQGTVVWKLGPRAQEAVNEMKTLFTELLRYESIQSTLDEPRLANA